jgi:molybdopterin-dependent oxidoreductase-like protein protein
MKRWTNLALFVVMGVAFFTGWLAFFYAAAPSRGSLIVHAVSGYAIIALTPWKSAIAVHGVKRRIRGWWASLLLTVLVVVSVLAGILHSSGLLVSLGQVSAMEVHVGAALVALPFALWHFIARRIPIRAVDLSRRGFLRATTLLAGTGLAYATAEMAIHALNLPGARRQLTGSYEFGSMQPAELPVTQWMFDQVPVVDPTRWRLEVSWPGGRRAWTYEDLLAFDDQMEATLDCTGGFYSTQRWSGALLGRLIPAGVRPVSLHVRSLTGYDRRFSIDGADRLLLATRLGGEQLEPGHGFPVRLVAPNQRGYWWVKWVASMALDQVPAWWQLPFPTQ